MSTKEDSDGPPWERLFADRMRLKREASGMSQTELARRLTERGLPFHQQQVQRIEIGNRPVRLNEALLLADLFSVPLNQWIEPNDADSLEQEVVRTVRALRVRASEWLNTAGMTSELVHNDYEALRISWEDYSRSCAAFGSEVNADLALEFRYLSIRLSRFEENAASAYDALLKIIDTDYA